MLSNKPISKAEKSRKILHESLENYDNIDIIDELNYEIDTINNLIANIGNIESDVATNNYIHDLINISVYVLDMIQHELWNKEM